MINPKSRSLEWITEVAQKMGVHDKSLIEKTIRAFSLLEALVRSDCPFLFKGGSSLMLHLNTSKRLSMVKSTAADMESVTVVTADGKLVDTVKSGARKCSVRLAPGVNIIEVKRDGIPAEQYKVVVR